MVWSPGGRSVQGGNVAQMKVSDVTTLGHPHQICCRAIASMPYLRFFYQHVLGIILQSKSPREHGDI